MVTEIKPTKIDSALQLLARMVVRAYLEDAQDKSNNDQFPGNNVKKTFAEEKDGNKGGM